MRYLVSRKVGGREVNYKGENRVSGFVMRRDVDLGKETWHRKEEKRTMMKETVMVAVFDYKERNKRW